MPRQHGFPQTSPVRVPCVLQVPPPLRPRSRRMASNPEFTLLALQSEAYVKRHRKILEELSLAIGEALFRLEEQELEEANQALVADDDDH